MLPRMKPSGDPESTPLPRVEAILVVGAGTMGAGIAQVAASAGFRTQVYDIDPARVANAFASISADLARGIELGKVTGIERADAERNLARATSLGGAAREADLVIEAVAEDLETKKSVIGDLARFIAADTLVATNTSALSVSVIASAAKHPESVVGMHFFNPPARMRLVELVRGKQTSAATLAAAAEVARRMGKQPIEVAESPAFVAGRLNAVLGNEAFRLLMEGVASAEDIDTAAELGLNHPMGPLRLGDLVGWDIRLEVLRHLHETLGEGYRPCPLLVSHVNEGRLGRKTGRGVYTYD
jgi:3-hydroxybutyryl-CoA dehydrogenase